MVPHKRMQANPAKAGPLMLALCVWQSIEASLRIKAYEINLEKSYGT